MAFRCMAILAAACLLLATSCSTDDPPLALGFPDTVAEGQSPGPEGIVTLPEPAETDVEVAVASSDPGFLSAPATVTVPAGQRQVTFAAIAVENTYLDIDDRTLTLTISADGYQSAQVSFLLSDNESRALMVTLPVSVTEDAASGTGTVSLQAGVISRNGLDISVDSGDTSAITVTDAVHIAPGSGSAEFDIYAPNDEDSESEIVEVYASHPHLVLGSDTMLADDDDD